MQKDEKLNQKEIKSLDRTKAVRFWRLEYTRRKFFLDDKGGRINAQQISDQYEAVRLFALELSSISSFLLLNQGHLSAYFDRFSSQFDYGENTPEICRATFLIERAIIYYHTLINKNPKYCFTDYTLACFAPALREIVCRFKKEIELLHSVSFHYGYFPVDLFDMREPATIFPMESYPEPRETFLRYRSDLEDLCRANYADHLGNNFFDPEDKNNIYIYFSVTDKDFRLEAAECKIANILNQKKKKAAYGDAEGANIQIIIKRMKLFDIEYITRWGSMLLRSYRTWLTQKDSFKNNAIEFAAIEGIKWEQSSLDARAIGLWLWDLCNLDGTTLADAARVVWGELKPPETAWKDKAPRNSRQETGFRQLQRDFRLAECCVEAMDVLTLQECKNRKRRSFDY